MLKMFKRSLLLAAGFCFALVSAAFPQSLMIQPGPTGATGATGAQGPAGPSFVPTITVDIVPLSGGGQAGATQLGYWYNELVTSHDPGDSVQLPAAAAGSVVMVFVEGPMATFIAVFAKEGTTDTINGFANATQFDFVGTNANTGRVAIFVCKTNGAWFANIDQD